MAVTFSYLFRAPITTQYPDRTPKPILDMIPDRYRGFLWVDLDICISCLLCERACPIDCIHIEDVKIDRLLVNSALDGKATPMIKDPTRFDINMYKCMYCGLCVEPCPTGAIKFTKEFEGSTSNLADLHLRFVAPERRETVLAANAEYERKEAAKKAAKAAAAAAAAKAAPAAAAKPAPAATEPAPAAPAKPAQAAANPAPGGDGAAPAVSPKPSPAPKQDGVAPAPASAPAPPPDPAPASPRTDREES